MSAYRVSSARQWRKFWVAVFGRRRRPFGWQPLTPVRKYRRPSVDERLEMWRLADQGLSGRQIARRLKRDHHTVLRALTKAQGTKLAYELAQNRRSKEAQQVALRVGGSRLRRAVNVFAGALWIQARQRAQQQADRVLPLMASLRMDTEGLSKSAVDEVLSGIPLVTDADIQRLLPVELRPKRRPFKPRRRRMVPLKIVYVTEPSEAVRLAQEPPSKQSSE